MQMPDSSAAQGQRQALMALCGKRLDAYNLIIASNRGPVEFRREEDALRSSRGQGGLVTAVSSMAEVMDATWVAAAMGPADLEAAREGSGRVTVSLHGHPVKVSFVAPTAEQYHAYYDQIANSVLWFLQHHITNPPAHPTFDQALWEAWNDGYVAVNRLFAERLVEEAEQDGRRPLFMVQDYHLYLVPGMLRELAPEGLIQHFTHVAWPGPDTWRQVPKAIRDRLLEAMLGCDVIGLHCQRYVFNFLLCCQELLGREVDWEQRAVKDGDRWVRVRDYPISIDPDALADFADAPDVLRAEAALMRHRPKNLIVQVARTDPSKNILRSFYAYEQFLLQYPEFHERVQFLGLLPTSRQTTELYKEYLVELRQVADRINEDYGSETWQPLELFLDNDYARGIAAMKHYDVLVVNSIADGMNLVAKEGPIVNRRHGVLVISEATGAVDELGEAALVVNPFDL
ncbi:MAG: trehalose-6-phosphate synthase, partial [Candidatus Sericytochromatia bacterium]